MELCSGLKGSLTDPGAVRTNLLNNYSLAIGILCIDLANLSQEIPINLRLQIAVFRLATDLWGLVEWDANRFFAVLLSDKVRRNWKNINRKTKNWLRASLTWVFWNPNHGIVTHRQHRQPARSRPTLHHWITQLISTQLILQRPALSNPVSDFHG